MANEMNLSSSRPMVEVRNISKSFGAVQALTNGNFALYGGEIHALGLGLRGGLGGVTPGRFPVVVPPPCAFPVVIVVGHHADQRRKGIAPGVGDGAAH